MRVSQSALLRSSIGSRALRYDSNRRCAVLAAAAPVSGSICAPASCAADAMAIAATTSG